MEQGDTRPINNDIYIQLFTLPKYRLLRHLFFLVLTAVILFTSYPTQPDPIHLYGTLLFFAFIVFIAYSNIYFGVPMFLLKKKYFQYLCGVITYLVIGLALNMAVVEIRKHYATSHDRNGYNNFNHTFPLFFIFIMLVLVGASAGIKLFQQWIKDAQHINELESRTIHTELEQLKKQINPHFLFNMLNNAIVLTRQDPEKAAQLLMKLSDLLRYQLYDSKLNKVLITSDIQFLTDLLNLEKTRRDNFEFTVDQKGELNGIQIPPLLFTVFVENAIKHNADADNTSYVDLHFEVHNNQLLFTCINSKPEKMAVQKNEGGLGLANVTRRLELLFPHKHVLSIKNETHIFHVNLVIDL